jgi:hypothetical protein
MAEKKRRVDAVIIGYGWTGAIMAKTLTDAGLSVVALERGPARDTAPDFSTHASSTSSDTACAATCAASGQRDSHGPAQSWRSGRPLSQIWLVRAWQRGRRRRRPLERPIVAGVAGRSQAAKPHRGALRKELHSGRHDDSGLSRHFRGARTSLRSLRESLRHIRRRRKPSRRNPTRRQPVRGRTQR